MKSRLVYLTPLVLAIGLGLILFTALGKDPTKLETARLNDPVPQFSLPSLRDADVLLTEDVFKHGPALLNVWATWCPACRSEHDYLMQLASEGVNVVGLNYKDDRVKALQWLVDLGDPYQAIIYDPKGAFGFDLGVYGAPETYVVDQNGYIRYRHVGEVNESVWLGTLKPLLDGLLNE